LKPEETVFDGDVAVDGKVLGANPAMEDGLWWTWVFCLQFLALQESTFFLSYHLSLLF
jgi:hypothetical protein